ncbi:D-isomer specific 2-hydroxyacid dehydrogenase, partial [Chytriomyces cf. hyalinus JEL632]
MGTSARTVTVPVMSDDGLSAFTHQVPVVAGINALKTTVQKADVVVNILPAKNSTHNLFDFEIFSRMTERDATFINLGRGATVVEQDLLRALDEPSIGLSHAILDVFQVEPLPLPSRLWGHPSVFITPHMATLTDDADAAPVIANSIKMFLAGH